MGSVGYPRNQPYSYYCIFDTEEQKIGFRKLEFDFKGYVAQLQDKGISIPGWLMIETEGVDS